MKKIKQVLAFAGKHKFLIIFAVLIMGGAFYWGYRKNNVEEQMQSQAQTAAVEKGDISVNVTGSGQVYAKSQVDLKPQVAGDGLDVISVSVKNDQEVKEGDLIATLDSTDAQKEVRDAQLNLQSAQIKQKQTNDQYDNQTEEEKWQRQLQEITVQQSINRLSEAQEDLQDYQIRAPFDGIVTGLSIEAGDSISRDDILASIITDEMHVEISLNEVDAARVKAGNAVTLTFDALPDAITTGEVSKIDTIGEVEQGVVSYGAEITIDNQDELELLKPGMSASAEIMIESKQDVLIVPNSAINSESGNSSFVMVSDGAPADASGGNDNFSAKRTTIETGITDGVYTEVLSGLKEGDVVVIQGASSNASNMSENSSNNNRSGGNLLFGGGSGRPR